MLLYRLFSLVSSHPLIEWNSCLCKATMNQNSVYSIFEFLCMLKIFFC